MEPELDAGASAPATETVVPAVPQPVTPQPVTIVENKPPTIEETMEAAWADIEKRDKPARAKGPDGKFVKQSPEPSEAATEGSAPDAEGEQEPADPQTQASDAAQAPAEAPLTWSADMRAKFQSLPPEFRDLQEYAAKRDRQQNDAIVRHQDQLKQADQWVKSYEPLGQLILAHRDDFARRGITPVQAFSFLMGTQKRLEQNPFQEWVQIGRSVGIDLGQILQAGGIDPRSVNIQPQQPNADVAALQAELHRVNGRLAAYEQRVVQQQTESQQWELSQAKSFLADFSKDKPFYDDVRELMAFYLVGNPEQGIGPQADTLQAAYEMAVNAKPETRQRVQADQRKAEEAKRKADEQAKAAEARRAANVNVTSVTARSNPKTLDDELREGVNRLYA